jgi:hypothetical protein
MTTTFDATSTQSSPPRIPPRSRRRDAVTAMIRFVIAVGAAGLLSWWWLERQPTSLRPPIDVLGYSTFRNFNYNPYFTRYRLGVYAAPVIILCVYQLLSWRGPLRRAAPPPPRRILLRDELVPRPRDDTVVVTASAAATFDVRLAFSVLLRLILPALIVAMSVSSRTGRSRDGISTAGLWCGLSYLLLIPAASIIYRRTRARNAIAPIDALAQANAVGAAAASIGGLWLASHYTEIAVASPRQSVHWRWLPWWIAAIGLLLTLGWLWLRYRRGVDARQSEKALLVFLSGSIFIFLAFAQLPRQLGRFVGYDDAHYFVGADLIERGYLPWRDQIYIHGPYIDALRAMVGFAVFEHSRWGAVAGVTVLLVPLAWVLLYLFTAWVSRGNVWFLLAFGVLAMTGVLGNVDPRFIAAPPTLILLGESLRRRSARWCVALTLTLIAGVLAVPEMAYLAGPAVLVIVLADFVHRRQRQPRPADFQRSIWCLATGLAASVVLLIALAASRSLGGFYDYVLAVGPGHASGSSIPAWGWAGRYAAEFIFCIVLVLLNFWIAIARVRARRSWEARDWVALATAGFVALYNEKALARLDAPHIQNVFTAALPLLIITIYTVTRDLDRGIILAARRLPRLLARMRRPIRAVVPHAQHVRLVGMRPTLVLAAVIILLLSGSNALRAAKAAPARLHATAATDPILPLAGYAAPGAIDYAMVSDFEKIIDAYAGPHGTVFDMTNSPGYFYYLLRARPATKFNHIDIASNIFGQKVAIEELKKSRPAIVVFNGSGIGLQNFDFISNNVRHYLISQYVLDGWRPYVLSHGFLFLLRNDLIPTAPPVPTLAVAATQTDLAFSVPACDWGYAANYLDSNPTGAVVSLPVGPPMLATTFSARGWVVDTETRGPVRQIVLAHGQSAVSAVATLGRPRPDIKAKLGPAASQAGFAISSALLGSQTPDVYAFESDGRLHPIGNPHDPSPTGMITLQDSTRYAVGSPATAKIDAISIVATHVQTITVLSGTNLSDANVLTLHSSAPFGTRNFRLTDDLGDGRHSIQAKSLPVAGRTLSIRVGSCIQWHGYRPNQLYLDIGNGGGVSSVTVSSRN